MSQHLNIATGQGGPSADLLADEWLLTNGRGSYASSTVVGVNTRKYHGLLVSAVRPPGERAVLLAALADELVLDGQVFPLACFEFDGVFHPRGDRLLTAFDCDKIAGCVRFTYRLGRATLTRTIALARGADALAVRYELGGRNGAGGEAGADRSPPAALRVTPLLAYRHYHANRRSTGQPAVTVESDGGPVRLGDPAGRLPAMRLETSAGRFAAAPDWWRRFFYRAEAERGEDPWEDLFAPGRFELAFDADGVAELRAAAEPFPPVAFAEAAASQREYCRKLMELAKQPSPAASRHLLPEGKGFPVEKGVRTPFSKKGPDTFSARQDLLVAASDFVVEAPGGGASILAGYHWFADWGRDAFIALPGLLLATGRADEAHGVLLRFARAIRNGLVPNRFSDNPAGEGEPCDYNSVDAALWFIRAAFAWADATGRWDDFDRELLGPARSILDAYHGGTDYGIAVAADGLLACGSPESQLTWMDAIADGVPVTPRAGKPVEVNALYGHGLGLVAGRLEAGGDAAAALYRDRLARWRAAFARTFPSPRGGLYDCIDPAGRPDDSIRPNQLFAVSLGDSPLPPERQREVVEQSRRRLLTPVGLRSLAPGEPGYRGRCTGPRRERDAAYHQGTVWAWLIGPFIEAYLRVEGFSDGAKRQAERWLSPLLEHMNGAAGLGQISEIFDGDEPHTPRGCIAQAWSVAEVLRIEAMI